MDTFIHFASLVEYECTQKSLLKSQLFSYGFTPLDISSSLGQILGQDFLVSTVPSDKWSNILVKSKHDHDTFYLIAVVLNFQVHFSQEMVKKSNTQKILPPKCDLMKRYAVGKTYTFRRKKIVTAFV